MERGKEEDKKVTRGRRGRGREGRRGEGRGGEGRGGEERGEEGWGSVFPLKTATLATRGRSYCSLHST